MAKAKAFSPTVWRGVWWGTLVGALWPLLWMSISAYRQTLGGNPIAEVLNRLGLLALVFLIASLGCTPAKTVFGWTWAIRLRRMLGVMSFTYALLHFLVYLVLDQDVNVVAVLEDIAKRPFILVGFTALLLLAPLAITSTDAMVRRLGFPRWKKLHRLAYVAGVLGVVHFILRVKADLDEPLVFAAVLALFFAVRLRGTKKAPSPRAQSASGSG
jgi:methionine sulfoxide reductase heme-binding subunit